MCGRFALFSDYSRLARRVGLSEAEREFAPRYNISPGTWILAVRRPCGDEPPVMEELWWGYKPAWAGAKAPQPINATLEKVATSNYYKGAFARHRCLIPADGWYEWLPLDGRKQPHYLCRGDREPIWLAGIWAERADGKPGVAILTEPARGIAQEIHSRMPLALDDASIDPWLDPDLTDRETVRNVIHHLDAEMLTHWPVSTAVNKPGNSEDATLINPA